jgi:hypothetical protein
LVRNYQQGIGTARLARVFRTTSMTIASAISGSLMKTLPFLLLTRTAALNAGGRPFRGC